MSYLQNFFHRLPEKVIEAMKLSAYLLPKRHVTGEVINRLRIRWYQLNYPSEIPQSLQDMAAIPFAHLSSTSRK